MALFSKGKEIFSCPIEGIIKDLKETPDQMFASKALGDGIVIYPTDNKIFAPADARINFTFPTRHAIQMETKSGLEFMIHVGINTCNLKGEGFHIYVNPKDHVNKGQLLLEFDRELIEKQGLSLATPFIFTNVEEDHIEVLKDGQVKANEDLLIVKK